MSPLLRTLALGLSCAHVWVALAPCLELPLNPGDTPTVAAASTAGDHAAHAHAHHEMPGDAHDGHSAHHAMPTDVHARHEMPDGANGGHAAHREAPLAPMPCHGAPPPEWQAVCPCGCDGMPTASPAGHGPDRFLLADTSVVPQPSVLPQAAPAPAPRASLPSDPPENVPILA